MHSSEGKIVIGERDIDINANNIMQNSVISSQINSLENTKINGPRYIDKSGENSYVNSKARPRKQKLLKRSPGRKNLQTLKDAERDSKDKKDKSEAAGLSKVNSSLNLAITGFKFETQTDK